MALLITFKSDQQSIIILKGKLFHSSNDQKLARGVYKKHAKILDVALASAGLSMICLSIALLANRNPLFYFSGAVGLALVGISIWGRCKTFVAADRELSEIGRSRRMGRRK